MTLINDIIFEQKILMGQLRYRIYDPILSKNEWHIFRAFQ